MLSEPELVIAESKLVDKNDCTKTHITIDCWCLDTLGHLHLSTNPFNFGVADIDVLLLELELSEVREVLAVVLMAPSPGVPHHQTHQPGQHQPPPEPKST